MTIIPPNKLVSNTLIQVVGFVNGKEPATETGKFISDSKSVSYLGCAFCYIFPESDSSTQDVKFFH